MNARPTYYMPASTNHDCHHVNIIQIIFEDFPNLYQDSIKSSIIQEAKSHLYDP